MFHVHLRAQAGLLRERAQRIAREQSIWTLREPAATALDGVVRWEINLGDAIIELGPARAHRAIDELLAPVDEG
jgi:hypothetical protein